MKVRSDVSTARPRTPRDAAPGLRPRPVQIVSAVDMVVEEIRRAIVDGSLAPGSTISIVELSEKLAVSHIPVREALRRLEGDGLIEMRRGGGAVIASLSVEDLNDVFHHLTLLECDVVSRGAKRFTVEQLEGMGEAWEALRVEPKDDPAGLSLRHAHFHQTLIAPVARLWDWRLLGPTWLAASRYMFGTLAETMTTSPTAFRDVHEPLLVAARSHSPAALRKAVAEHLERDRALAEAALAGTGDQ